MKAAEQFLAFLKGEQDRHAARVRLFEARAQTMATFAGAAGSLAALLKPPNPHWVVLVALCVTAFLTLSVIWQAFHVHRNRASKAAGGEGWEEQMVQEIWHQQKPPMYVLNQLHRAYIANIKEALKLSEEKAASVNELQIVFTLQIASVLVSIILSAVLGGSK